MLHPTAAAAQPSKPAEMVPLAVTCPPDTVNREGCFLQLDYKVIKKQTCCVQTGRNPSAASLKFVAHAKDWKEIKGLGTRTRSTHTVQDTL